jgi:hypothetical protein
MVAPLGNLIPFSSKQLIFTNYIQTIFSSILFVDEKENSEKGLNLEPLGYRGDSNHCISFFSFENDLKQTSTINHCVGTIKRNLIFFSLLALYYIVL